MKREHLEINGKPFIPSWVVREWGGRVWSDTKRKYKFAGIGVKYDPDHHGYFCYSRMSNVEHLIVK